MSDSKRTHTIVDLYQKILSIAGAVRWCELVEALAERIEKSSWAEGWRGDSILKNVLLDNLSKLVVIRNAGKHS